MQGWTGAIEVEVVDVGRQLVFTAVSHVCLLPRVRVLEVQLNAHEVEVEGGERQLQDDQVDLGHEG